MTEHAKAQWHHVEAIRTMEGIVDVKWGNTLCVIIHRDVKEQVRAVLTNKGYNGEVVFEEIADDADVIMGYQAQFLNNFDLLLVPSGRRQDLGNFGIHLDHPMYDDIRPLWRAVDEVMREHGITSQGLQELQDRLAENTDMDFNKNPAYLAVIVPLFLALRKRGFSAIELRG